MTKSLLDINDAGLTVFSGQEEALVSPGFACADGASSFFGSEGEARVKLLPTNTEYHFWDRLSMDALDTPTNLGRSHADLAYAHLASIAAELDGMPELMVAVAADLERNQLALLLGMLQRLKWPVIAVADAAILACRKFAPGRKLFHLESHLHRTVLTELDQADVLRLKASKTTREIGLMRLREAWSDTISRLFVRATRFDPHHDAAIEQQLYDRINPWLASLVDESEIEIDLVRDENRFATWLDRDSIVNAAAPQYRLLIEFLREQLPVDQPVCLELGPRVANLPGLLPLLEELPDCDIRLGKTSAMYDSARELATALSADTGRVPYVNSKAWFGMIEAEKHDSALQDYQRQAPTHVLFRARAYPLGAKGLSLGSADAADDDHLCIDDGASQVEAEHCRLVPDSGQVFLDNEGGGPMRLNGKLLGERAAVGVGDKISLGQPETELLLISIAGEPDGS